MGSIGIYSSDEKCMKEKRATLSVTQTAVSIRAFATLTARRISETKRCRLYRVFVFFFWYYLLVVYSVSTDDVSIIGARDLGRSAERGIGSSYN